MATSGRNRRLEPSFKRQTAVEDQSGVMLDVTLTTGEVNEDQVLERQIDAIARLTGETILTVTRLDAPEAGYAAAAWPRREMEGGTIARRDWIGTTWLPTKAGRDYPTAVTIGRGPGLRTRPPRAQGCLLWSRASMRNRASQ